MPRAQCGPPVLFNQLTFTSCHWKKMHITKISFFVSPFWICFQLYKERPLQRNYGIKEIWKLNLSYRGSNGPRVIPRSLSPLWAVLWSCGSLCWPHLCTFPWALSLRQSGDCSGWWHYMSCNILQLWSIYKYIGSIPFQRKCSSILSFLNVWKLKGLCTTGTV